MNLRLGILEKQHFNAQGSATTKPPIFSAEKSTLQLTSMIRDPLITDESNIRLNRERQGAQHIHNGDV